MTEKSSSPQKGPTGTGFYKAWVLQHIYDNLVLRFASTFVWRCPAKSQLVPLFASHFSKSSSQVLCDIGVGTGYYYSHISLPPDASVTLVDANPNCLQKASKKLLKSHAKIKCSTLQSNILKVGENSEKDGALASGGFDAVALMYLLHCLPCSTAEKGAVLVQLAKSLKNDGVLFGTTVLGKGVEHNAMGRWFMKTYNGNGTFTNYEDSAEGFLEPLRTAFEIVQWRIEGVVLIFEASRPIR